MNLTEAFEQTADNTIREQSDARNLEQAFAHAKPLLQILATIRDAVPVNDKEQFYFSNDHFHTSWDGYLSLQVGFTKDGKWVPVPDSERNFFGDGLNKAAVFSVHADGHVHATRYDKGTKNFSAPSGYDFTHATLPNVKAALPLLAAWVEDNLPEAVESLIPKPVVPTGRGAGISI